MPLNEMKNDKNSLWGGVNILKNGIVRQEKKLVHILWFGVILAFEGFMCHNAQI